MLRTDFEEKCIIVQFLEVENGRKRSERRIRRDKQKRLVEDRRSENHPSKETQTHQKVSFLPKTPVGKAYAYEIIFPVSPLFA